MMRANVMVAFRDRHTWAAYAPGDTFEGSEGRVSELRSLGILGGCPEAPEPTADLSALTAAQLRELCGERGIEAPKKATKAQLTALLAE